MFGYLYFAMAISSLFLILQGLIYFDKKSMIFKFSCLYFINNFVYFLVLFLDVKSVLLYALFSLTKLNFVLLTLFLFIKLYPKIKYFYILFSSILIIRFISSIYNKMMTSNIASKELNYYISYNNQFIFNRVLYFLILISLASILLSSLFKLFNSYLYNQINNYFKNWTLALIIIIVSANFLINLILFFYFENTSNKMFINQINWKIHAN